jgi:hypothetical protein
MELRDALSVKKRTLGHKTVGRIIHLITGSPVLIRVKINTVKTDIKPNDKRI